MNCRIKIKSLRFGNYRKVCVNRKVSQTSVKLSLRQRSLSFKCVVWTCGLSPALLPLPSVALFFLSEEDDKDDEEDDEDEKDLDHQPAVGGDWLEVFEDLCVGGLHIQLGVLHVGVDPVRDTWKASQWDKTLKMHIIHFPSNESVQKITGKMFTWWNASIL